VASACMRNGWTRAATCARASAPAHADLRRSMHGDRRPQLLCSGVAGDARTGTPGVSRMINWVTGSIVCVLVCCGVVAVTVGLVAWISAALTGSLLVL
jgi:hypothetical protein